MRRSLLLLGVAAALAVGGPAYSQFIFMDVNGDNVCTSADVLTSATTQVHVWLDTNHNAAGDPVACSDGIHPLDNGLYDIIVHSAGSGSVTFNGYTNVLAGFSLLNPFTVAGPDMAVGYNGATYVEGLMKLGTISVTVTGTPQLSFLSAAPSPSFPSPFTAFASHCDGTVNPNYITLGIDFNDNCGTSSSTPTESTTWGKIKQLYR